MPSCRSVGWLVCWLVCLSVQKVCEKVTFRVSNGNLTLPKTYLLTYLCDSSDSSDNIYSSDSSDSNDSSDSSDSSDQKFSYFPPPLKLQQNLKTKIVTKLWNSNCDKTQKLKMWKNSKSQIVTKL